MNRTLSLVDQAQKIFSSSKSISFDLKQRFNNSRCWLDQGLHSCQFWWASGRPWYSSEMILKGLNQLILSSSEALKIILNLSDNDSDKKKALRVFDEIFEAQKEIYLIV